MAWSPQGRAGTPLAPGAHPHHDQGLQWGDRGAPGGDLQGSAPTAPAAVGTGAGGAPVCRRNEGPHVVFALYLGFISGLPKRGSTEPSETAGTRQTGGLSCAARTGFYFPFLPRCFFWEVADIWEALGQSHTAMALVNAWRGPTPHPPPPSSHLLRSRNACLGKEGCSL